MTYLHPGADGSHIHVDTDTTEPDGVPVIAITTSSRYGQGPFVQVDLDRVEELIAGIRDTARTAAGNEEMAASLRRDGFGDDEITDILARPLPTARNAAAFGTAMDSQPNAKATIALDTTGDPEFPIYQISINAMRDKHHGHGYRLMGPTYVGRSRNLRTVELTQRDADEIRAVLDEVFPPAPPAVEETDQ